LNEKELKKKKRREFFFYEGWFVENLKKRIHEGERYDEGKERGDFVRSFSSFGFFLNLLFSHQEEEEEEEGEERIEEEKSKNKKRRSKKKKRKQSSFL
jgi:hypothetical protein